MLEFRFLKLNGTNKSLLGSACLVTIAHLGRQLLRIPDVPLAQPILQTQLRLLPPFCRIYFPSSSATPLAAAMLPPSAAACF